MTKLENNQAPNTKSLIQQKLANVKLMTASQWDHTRLMLLALVAGVVCGHGAVFFYLAIDWLLNLGFGAGEEELSSRVVSLTWWHLLLVPTLAGIIVGQLRRLISREHILGVPDVIEAAALKDSRIPLKDGLLSALATIISLGGGSSTGREGPMVHLGATLTGAMSRFLSFSPHTARIFLGCGVAAAVAASFNAPIAGVFFALEVIIGHYALHTFTPIVISAIAGTLVSRAWLGDYPAFAVAEYPTTAAIELPAFLLLGVFSALIAVVFVRSLFLTSKLCQDYIPQRLPKSLYPAIGGFLVGSMALVLPEILSVGYEATSQAVNGGYGFLILATLVVAKIVATSLSIGLRFAGGVFSPSLFIGAMAGGAFGITAASVFPELASHQGLYAIAGMGAVSSAVLGAPISTILIVFEMTGDYSVTIAVMVASSVASLVYGILVPKGSFFHQQLAARGLHLENGRASYLLNSVTVADHIDRDFFTVLDTDLALKARAHLLTLNGDPLIVTDQSGGLRGTLTLANLGDDIFDDAEMAGRTVETLLKQDPMCIKSTARLQEAITVMERHGVNFLAVVQADNQNTVIGLVRYRRLMAEYNLALLESQGRNS